MLHSKYILLMLLFPLTGIAKINVVSSTSDLAYFAREIGGEFVDVSYIAPPNSDIHFVEARPSFMVKVSKADIVLKVGMELDLWMDLLIDGSRNSRLLVIDCSKYVEPLNVPSFKADARHGDIHRLGNPHYWVGPQNAKPITDAIVEGLAKVSPEHSAQFSANRDKLLKDISDSIELLQHKLAKLKGTPVIFYHDSWPYFNKFAGTVATEFIEPYPGVSPSPSHVKKLMELMKTSGIKVIAMEPYFDDRVPQKIARESGAKVVTLYPSIEGRVKGETYLEWLEFNINAILNAAQ